MKPSKIAFEKHYQDNSGIELAVRYDASLDYGLIIESGSTSTRFRVEEIEFIRDALYEIVRSLPDERKAAA